MAASADDAGGKPESPAGESRRSAVPEYGVQTGGEEAAGRVDPEGESMRARLPSLPDVSARLSRLKDRLPKPTGLAKPTGSSETKGKAPRHRVKPARPAPVPPRAAAPSDGAGGPVPDASAPRPVPQPPPPASPTGPAPQLSATAADRSGRWPRAASSPKSPSQTAPGPADYQPRRRVGQEPLVPGQDDLFDEGATAVVGIPAGEALLRPGRPVTGTPAGPVRQGPTGSQMVRRPPRVGVRPERRMIRRIDTWTVFKVSILFYMCAVAIMLIAGALLWNVAASSGTLHNVEKFIRTLLALKSFQFHAGTIFEWSVLAGAVFVLAGTFVNVVAALIYNLISDVVGGIQVVELGEPD